MLSTTLSGKSVVEEDSQSVEDTLWETTTSVSELEDTMTQSEEARSCVAHRTRSHTGETRKLNLTELLDACGSNMEESYEIVETNAKDSLDLGTTRILEGDRENRGKWCEEIKRLDTSINKMIEVWHQENKRKC